MKQKIHYRGGEQMAKRSLKERVAELESRLVKVEQSVAEVTRLRFHLKNELLGEIQPLTADNPIFQMVGIGASGKGDISSNKYKYLSEAKKKTMGSGGE
jgi:hypothetical protein